MDKGRMPDGMPPPEQDGALIGPNALLQLLPVLDRVGGPELRTRIFARAGVFEIPEGADGLIPEGPVARVHQEMRRALPEMAPMLAWEAGKRTGDYILINRIPRGAQGILKALPAWAAAPILAHAVAKHAWTFAGSGRFSVVSTRPLVFELADNPVVRGEAAGHPLCHWHAAVFERLFTRLIDPRLRCAETACCAMGAPACRFEIAIPAA